jgi:hypothetical protein
MNERLLEPLKYYETKGKAEHNENVNAYFDTLVSSSHIDVEANRATVKKYHKELDTIKGIEGRLSKYNALRILSIIGIILASVAFIVGVAIIAQNTGLGIGLIIGGAAIIVLLILAIVKKINPRMREIQGLIDQHRKIANEILAEAQAQMSPLNELFDERDTFNLIEKTIPEMDFEGKFTTEQEELFKKHYDFFDLNNKDSSMINTVSGKFEGNPFLFCQCLKHELKSATYHGSLVIRWTETYRDSDGKTRTRRRTQTLTASVTKPKPYYHLNNYLAYGNQAAPDLTFSRSPQVSDGMDDKDIDKKVKKGKKKLAKKAQKALSKGGHFQEMANEEFDVLFGATNRDNEVQFRLMYTPLGQTNTVDLIRSDSGYGDDFYFTKQKKFNIITSKHAQKWDMDTSPSKYYSYDIDDARRKFVEFNNEYFKSVFFDFAPLFAVPAYLEEPCASLEAPEEFMSNYTYYEHEAIANLLDRRELLPEEALNNAILKTSLVEKLSGEDLVSVTAHGYTTMEHIDYIPVRGGDGRIHGVPVQWTEYIPIQGVRNILVSHSGMSKKDYTARINTDESIRGSSYFHGLLAKFVN